MAVDEDRNILRKWAASKKCRACGGKNVVRVMRDNWRSLTNFAVE